MINFFKTNDPYRFVLFALFFIALRTLMFFWDLPLTNVELKLLLSARSIEAGHWLYRDIWIPVEPLSALVYFLLPKEINVLHAVTYSLNTILLIFNAFFFNTLLQKQEVFSEKNYLSAFFILFFSLLFVELSTLSTQLLSSTMLLFVLGRIFSYLKKEDAKKMYDTGFFLGLASLFYFPSIFFAATILLTMLLYTRSAGRSYFLFLLGCCFPWLVLSVVYLLQDGLEDMSTILLHHYFDHTANYISYRELFYILIAPFVVFLTGALIGSKQHLREINYQSICRVFLALWLISGLLVCSIAPEKSISLLYILIYPSAFFFTFYFLRLKKHFIPNLVLVFALAAVVVCQYAFVNHKIWRDSMLKMKVEAATPKEMEDKKVWVIGTNTYYYLRSKITTKYYDWPVSQIDLGNTNRFSNIEKIRKNIYDDLPEVIVDENNLMPSLSNRIPSLNRDYTRDERNRYFLQR